MSTQGVRPQESFWGSVLSHGVGKKRSYQYFFAIFLAIIGLELFGTFGIIEYVPYTNIDWDAYMEEVEGVVNGTYDYMQLKGDTGPLVYPAGFVYIFAGLYYATDHGKDVRLAQYMWMGLYIATMVVVLLLYRAGKRVPLWALFLLACSRRVHSIFVLRLFNDCWAVFLSMVAFYLFTIDAWTVGCLFFSLAVSVKMNILLYAPGLLLLLWKRFGFVGAIPRLVVCAVPQVVLAWPFLKSNAWGYLSRSFDLGRQFFYVWSVNWQFVPEEVFLSTWWGVLLLALTLSSILLFVFFKWTHEEAFRSLLAGAYANRRLTADHILIVLFTSNYIGIVLARSLHYQFYVWYFFTLPYLLWSTAYPTPIRVALLFTIEVAWNIYPTNAYASAALFAAHAILFIGLVATPLQPSYHEDDSSTKKIGQKKLQ
jgi:alpha-1,3-mannosyltransferase